MNPNHDSGYVTIIGNAFDGEKPTVVMNSVTTNNSTSTSYKCKSCGVVYLQLQQMKNHYESNHIANKAISCDLVSSNTLSSLMAPSQSKQMSVCVDETSDTKSTNNSEPAAIVGTDRTFVSLKCCIGPQTAEKRKEIETESESLKSKRKVNSYSAMNEYSVEERVKRSANVKITITNWFTNCFEVRTPYYPQIDDKVIISVSAYKYFEVKLINDCSSLQKSEFPKSISNILRLSGSVRDLVFQNSDSNYVILMVLQIEECDACINLWWSNIPAPDFIVLKSHYKKGDWDVGDRCRAMINEVWWSGSITQFADNQSLFQCFKVKFDNGDTDLLSPWELHKPNRLQRPKSKKAGVRLCTDELPLLLYSPIEEDWPIKGRDAECDRILRGVQVMLNSGGDSLFKGLRLKTALRNFNLSTIRDRLENKFYRRLNSIFFDTNLLKQAFSQCDRSLLKKKRKATHILDALEEYISNPDCENIIEVFVQLELNK